MDKVGVIHGRFQVLHNDHMKYLLEGKRCCEHLIVGICNPEMSLTRYTETNPHRSRISANPLTFFERAECIKDALTDAGIQRDQFDIVPFPINYPEKLFNYVPMDAVFYMTIYDQWGWEKYGILKNQLNLKVKVLWEVPLEQKGISASDIRSAIHDGYEWKNMVPVSVYNYIISKGIDIRIKKMLEEGN